MRWWWHIRGRLAATRSGRLFDRASALAERADALRLRAEGSFRRARGEGDDG